MTAPIASSARPDYLTYLRYLKRYAAQHGCSIHAYCLMTNHEAARSVLRSNREHGARTQRHPLRWAVLFLPCSDRRVRADVLPLHRAQSGTRAPRAERRRLSLVELQSEFLRHRRRRGSASSRLGGPGERPAARASAIPSYRKFAPAPAMAADWVSCANPEAAQRGEASRFPLKWGLSPLTSSRNVLPGLRSRARAATLAVSNEARVRCPLAACLGLQNRALLKPRSRGVFFF
jgi:hypothetical protein